MKCRFTDKQKAKGIALVITLVMLSVVTVMAIVFLAVTRRERSSVIVTEETAVAKDMADAALARAKTEAMAKMNANGSRLHYDIFNSTAFFTPGPNVTAQNPIGGNGFRGNVESPTNVAHVIYWRSMPRPNFLRNLANLQHDPPVPVFIETNRTTGQQDFRFFLDFNRNRQFETNYVGFPVDENFRAITNSSGRFTGDPEWIGVLERPDFPHSETNRFVGRLAYLVLPAGKTLDLNFMHNQVRPGAENLLTGPNGFSRSQGVGSWEINLAAFLRELNGNPYAWHPPQANLQYQFQLQPASRTFQAQGVPFDNARSLLAYRLLDSTGASQQDNLDSIYNTLGFYNLMNPNVPQGRFATVYGNNFVEDFSRRAFLGNAGQVFFPPTGIPADNDTVNERGWPGSVSTNAFTDIQQLFSVEASSPDFVARLTDTARFNAVGNSGRSSYDRYTFYRLASQLGTDSTPALEGKMHLNFKNPVGLLTNVTERWFDNTTNAIMFFTNAADLMLKASIDGTIVISNRQQELAYGRPIINNQPTPYYILGGDTLVRTNFSATNIQVYATHPRLPGVVMNEYTPTVHRIFQVAANIYDSMTNRVAPAEMLPSVFLPVFNKTTTNIFISHFVEVRDESTNNAGVFLARPWYDPQTALTNSNGRELRLCNLYGQHMVIGAKKGHPNFNELALNTRVEFSRKLAFTKDSANSTNIISTNQMYLMGLEQRWGLEAWNSYLATNRRPMTVQGEIISFVMLRDGTNTFDLPVYTNTVAFAATTNLASWRGRATVTVDRNMVALIDQTASLLNERSYRTENGTIQGTNRFRGNNDSDYTAHFELPPQFILYTTNRVRFWIMDDNTGRLVDFVSFDRLATQMDLREQLRDNTRSVAGTNSNRISYWDTNIIAGNITVGVSNQLAVSLGNLEEPQWRNYRYNSPDKRGSISKFRAFLGLPLRTGIDTNVNPQAQGIRQQVPFTPTRQIIQRLTWQVNDPLVHYMYEDLRRDRAGERPLVFEGVGPAINNTNLWNIGRRNNAYHPWGGADDVQQDPFSWNVGLMDPGVRSSDDWDFLPRYTNFNHYPNIGTLGQVHRGTAWQTIYLKSFYRQNPDTGQIEFFAPPSVWYNWAGSIGTHPMRDWALLDVFTAAPNVNAARGLLSVNQTNTAAWSAVLSGTLAATNITSHSQALQNRTRGVDPVTAYQPFVIEPGSPQISEIVRSINHARANQFDIVRNPDPNANQNMPFVPIWRTNVLAGKRAEVFRTMGEIVSAPALSVQSPFLNRAQVQVQGVWTDRAVEYIPQQILSLLKRDEPRFVVYAFGQSLKPAPRSLTTDSAYYHMCTNYQVTGEVITKTTFRVEGEPMNPQNPLRPVVEKYEILPPLE